MFKFNLTELTDKVVFIEYHSVPREIAETLRKDLEEKGFQVILGGTA